MKRRIVAIMLILAVCSNLHTTAFAAKDSGWTADWEPTEMEGMATGSTSASDNVNGSTGDIGYVEISGSDSISDTTDTDTGSDTSTTTGDMGWNEISGSDVITDKTEDSTNNDTTDSTTTTTKDSNTTLKSEIVASESGAEIGENKGTTNDNADNKAESKTVVTTVGVGIDEDKKDEEKDEKTIRNEKIQQELKDYAKSIGFTDLRLYGKDSMKYTHEYDEKPVIGDDSCVAGKLSDKTLQEGLNLINMIRKAAGLGEVELDDTYNEYAQNGALIMKASENTIINGIDYGGLSHNPIRVDKVSDEQNTLGKKGTRGGNIGYGHTSLTQSILNGYMYDGYNNIQGLRNAVTVGHRRWILNPTMGKVGFGQVEDYNCMYAHDTSVNSKIEDFIAWPAENMPIELMPYDYDKKLLLNVETKEFDDESRIVSAMDTPWSCQLGEKYKLVGSRQLTITVTYPDGHEYIVPQDNIFCNDQNYGCAVPTYDKDGTLIDYGVRGRGCITFLAKDKASESTLLKEKRERYKEEEDKIVAAMGEKKIGGIAGDISPHVGFEDFGNNYKVKIEGVIDSKTGKATTIEYDVNFFNLF